MLYRGYYLKLYLNAEFPVGFDSVKGGLWLLFGFTLHRQVEIHADSFARSKNSNPDRALSAQNNAFSNFGIPLY